MDVQTLFGDVSVAKFIEEHLHRLPFALAGSVRPVCEFANWDAIGAMLACAGDDAHAARGGEFYRGEMPRETAAARALTDEGYTLFIRHAERHQAGLAELAKAFEATFRGSVNIHVFATPAGSPGFSWHYDAEDVFIFQTAGAKEYSLRKNTVNPWPLEETLPADMRYEREIMPLMRVLLRAGDMLYIPCGYWHKADALATGEAAISIALGVMSRSAMDVYDFLRQRLAQSLVWRQRLPLPGCEAIPRDQLVEVYQHLFRQLSDDLSRTLTDREVVRDFLRTFGEETGENLQ